MTLQMTTKMTARFRGKLIM